MQNDFSAAVALPNVAVLRIKCIERFWKNPSAQFSEPEYEKIGELFTKAALAFTKSHRTKGVKSTWQDNEGLMIIARDIEDFPLPQPKWAVLSAWLAPESAVQHCPDLVISIVDLALKNKLKV
ncbi:MAG: hypothetical protein RLZZ487_2324 [Pseudomonadota bacterium]|jgi:hypothetical protein